ncbi:Tc toxin subunit A-related protein [Pseudomonas sp. RT6P73]
MENLEINELTQGYTAAMVEAYLGQALWEGAITLHTLDELWEYLMMDTQDSAELQATWLSTNVRCLQQHIQSVYSGMEPGYEEAYFDEEDLEYWYQILSHYSTWSANVILQDMAANYIEPSLRLNKTDLFRTLENSLQHMRLTTDSVQKGLMEFVQAFQSICDLDVISAYIDGANMQDAVYCLLGKERTSPGAYYWRTVKVELDNNSPRINPLAWKEWQKIDLAITDKVIDIRPVYWGGRLTIVWCEWRERQIDSNGVVQSPWRLELKVSFSSLNGQWSAPVSLYQRDCEHDVSNGRLTVSSLGDGDPRDDLLAVCYTNRHSLDSTPSYHEIEIHEIRDALLREVNEVNATATLLEMTFARFRNPQSLQQKVVPEDYSKVTIEISPQKTGSLNAHLVLDVIHTREIGPNNNHREVLRVRGRCDAVEETGRVLERLFISWNALAADQSVDIRIVEAGERQLKITFTAQDKPVQVYKLERKEGLIKETIHSFTADDFEETSVGAGVWVATAVVTLNDVSLKYLLGKNHDEILAGAGLSVTTLGDAVLNEQNVVVPRIQYATVNFSLKLTTRDPTDVEDWRSTGPLDGTFATPWRTYTRSIASFDRKSFPIHEPIKFTFGEESTPSSYGRNTFAVSLHESPRLYTTPSIDKNNLKGAQFLIFNNATQALKFVRLNTLFGAVLISRAAISVDALLAWVTQHIEEPLGPDETIEKNGPFDGCNGRYFWELFFHLPDLVGSRLMEEGRHREAQDWFEYIFNPLAREITAVVNQAPNEIPAPAYWRCRPLQNDIDPAYENDGPNDPDKIGYSAPIHFKMAIFMRYVQNLISWGDALYRHLDYDSMVAAKLNYSRALSLMGSEPDARTVSIWKPMTLEELMAQIRGRDQLKDFEANFRVSLAEVPTSMKTTPRFGLLGADVFLPGINPKPKAMRTLLNSRLTNLRNNRSIDGQPLNIRDFALPMDPKDLLLAQANANSGLPRNPGGQVQVVPYKWQTVYNLALQCVEFLIQQEDQLRSWLEKRDQGTLEELMQGHVIELEEYAKAIHEATIAQHEALAASLRQSESMLDARAQHYKRLSTERVWDAERSVQEKNRTAGHIAMGASVFRSLSGVLRTFPKVFGMANGGGDVSGPTSALAEIILIGADLLRLQAAEDDVNVQHRRRQQEWEFALDQSIAEVSVVREQLRAQEHAVSAALASLQQTQMANAQAREVYAFYKNRSTGLELSNWVVGQVKTLIYQLYDLAVGLCLMAETCWHYEMADYNPRFIRPDVWRDSCHGFTAGFSLKLDLLKMATARIKRDEHRLQLVKTISLKNLSTEADWDDFIADGTLTFNLNEKLFNLDYPGHYCRQVKRLSLTFPGLLGPYQNMCAVLVQISSATILEPDIDAVKYLHSEGTSTPPAGNTLVQNLRPYQQVALSSGLFDEGAPDNADDGRYRSFEGTGAHARYVLTFPRAEKSSTQKDFLRSMTDVIMTVEYQAKDGGREFGTKVEETLESDTGMRVMAGKATPEGKSQP